jgi:hypothetical protein
VNSDRDFLLDIVEMIDRYRPEATAASTVFPSSG